MSNPFVDMMARLSSLEARVAGMVRHAPVEEVNASEGWVRLKLGEGDSGPLLSPKIPYGQMAGALKVHSPPSKGQTMTMISPTGDPRQAVAMPMTWSDQNKSPSSKGDENVITYGGFRIKLDGDSLTVTKGAVTFDISGSGVAIKGDVKVDGALDVTGSSFTHNGSNVGSDHKHSGVTPGNSNTGPPA